MSDWISRPELESLIGKEAAETLCFAYGGVPFYVPVRPKKGMDLAKVIGFDKICALCSIYGGSYITVPLGAKPQPHKGRIIALLNEGRTPPQIARTLGTTERYVRVIASQYRRKPKQLTLFVK